MPRISVTIVAMMLVAGICSTLDAGPLLATDQLEFDFGFSPQNSKVCRIFQLRNDGDDTLRITRVVPGCGCTQTPLADSILAPGETTQLEIIFSTGHYSGIVTKRPRIETNEAESGRYVAISTNVVQRPDSTYPVQIRPYKLDMSQFGETVRDQMKFAIVNVSDKNLGLTLVNCPDKLLSIELPSELPAGGSIEALAKLTPGAVKTSFETSFTIQLSDDAKTRFTIPVKRTIKSPGQTAATTGTNQQKP